MDQQKPVLVFVKRTHATVLAQTHNSMISWGKYKFTIALQPPKNNVWLDIFWLAKYTETIKLSQWKWGSPFMTFATMTMTCNPTKFTCLFHSYLIKVRHLHLKYTYIKEKYWHSNYYKDLLLLWKGSAENAVWKFTYCSTLAFCTQ